MEPKEQELARLRDAMEHAKALYEAVKAEHDLAVLRMQDLGATHPDGSIRHATHVYNFVVEIYRNALLEYNRFVLDHPPPIVKWF